MRLLVSLVVLMAAAEVIVLALYVREVEMNADLRVQMEFANGRAALCRP